jgi:hypothetical protein
MQLKLWVKNKIIKPQLACYKIVEVFLRGV